MASKVVNSALPKCKIIEALKRKSQLRDDIDFDYEGTLNAFRKRVVPELTRINVLFPEYTPHDENYHIKTVFRVADLVLGKDQIGRMNAAELLVLAISIYAHDWGMAVSEDEREYIVKGTVAEGRRPEDFSILPDELLRLRKFANDQLLIRNTGEPIPEIPPDLWRVYVRETHAWRSGVRVRQYFDTLDRGVGSAAARVCEGHWIEFEELEDRVSYPTDFSVLEEPVNLRALSLCLRLIDLLDLSEERTPYVLWKFVSPKDPYSRMEWKKHRAVHSVTTKPYLSGRSVLIDGDTSDHEVYAALEDMKTYIQQQLQGCRDLFARMNDPRYRFDIIDVEWRIVPQGFEPASASFQFERDAMFRILSDEIYQGDPYVFLRELLQNSIDAIKVRREVLQRDGTASPDLGVIRVDVQHQENGSAMVRWTDDGIGMDEFIVRNYLAVAGRSFYRSNDFEKLGLKMDPISRFGVGILSCFMVADKIEIETFRDPNLPPPAHPLRITIPDMRRQFRIERLPGEVGRKGTTVKVFVDGRKLPRLDGSDTPIHLDVTRYLSIVAGFVEFPIVITEDDRKTVILHPKQIAQDAITRFGEDFTVRQLPLIMPWSDAFLPQDLPNARRYLVEIVTDLQTDLGLQQYEGTLSLLAPSSECEDISYLDDYDQAQVEILSLPSKPTIRWSTAWSTQVQTEPGFSRSADRSPRYGVYCNGVLVSQAGTPTMFNRRDYSSSIAVPMMAVNLIGGRDRPVDVSRCSFLGGGSKWEVPVYKAHLERAKSTCFRRLLDLDPKQRLLQMGRLALIQHLRVDDIWEAFPREHWPIVLLSPGGCLEYSELSLALTDEVLDLPYLVSLMFDEVFEVDLLSTEPVDERLRGYSGKTCVLVRGATAHRGSISSVDCALEIVSRPFREYVLKRIKFITPPWEGDPPLWQGVYVPEGGQLSTVTTLNVLEKALVEPSALTATELRVFTRAANFSWPLRCAEFDAPYKEFFGFGLSLLNVNHRLTTELLRLLACIGLGKQQALLTPARLGNLQDAMNKLLRSAYLDGLSVETVKEALKNLGDATDQSGILAKYQIELQPPSSNDFVPGTLSSVFSEELFEKLLDSLPQQKPFGALLGE